MQAFNFHAEQEGQNSKRAWLSEINVVINKLF
jgi:hypothetical protein